MEISEEFHPVAVKQERLDEEEDSSIWNGGAEMITVKVEPGLTVPPDCESPQKLNQENEYTVAYRSHLLENRKPANFYIAKLSQKLNSKLNTVLSPQNDNSILNATEHHQSCSSKGNSQGGASECSRCFATFASVKDLEEHALDCDGSPSLKVSSRIGDGKTKNIYHCNLCDKTYAGKNFLKRHLVSHLVPLDFTCVVCEASFSTFQDLQIHRIFHLKHFPYVCPKCNRGFPTLDLLREHAPVHSKDMPFSCRFCGKLFMQAKNLSSHMKVHSGVTIYPCDECERSFDTEEKRTIHKEHHKLVMPYKCAVCNQSFPTQRQRQVHGDIHDVENPQKSAHCDKTFEHEAGYKAHIKAVHTKISSVCEECDQLANSVTCDDTEEFMCKECDLPFLHKRCLASHILAHPKNGRVSCYTCGKGFPHLSAYHRHMLEHTGERPFTCTECRRCFSTRTNLKEHMRMHWRERPLRARSVGINAR